MKTGLTGFFVWGKKKDRAARVGLSCDLGLPGSGAGSDFGLFLAYPALLDYLVNPAKSRSSCQSIRSILSKNPVHHFEGIESVFCALQ